ncbi:hypothetical protein [Lewinella sp. 4G2]|uniref:hypothetical protein n=1 Tax=Lewinella sp. 4G2 TaxID=1803372 RepID=UPI0012F89799|nr:hypothetical protein [Lewinella sp. 4G2]
MLATKVIATGVTHLTDARYFAAWEVQLLAFPLGPGGVDWTTLNAMREWITGPEIAVELSSGADAGAVLEGMVEHGLTSVVIPNSAPAAAQKTFLDGDRKVYAHLPVAGYHSTEDVREALEELTEATGIILDFEDGGITWQDLAEGSPFTLDDLRELLKAYPIYLQIALADTDPKGIVTDFSSRGFAVRGSSEEKVGYKSFDDIDPLFEGLEIFE